MFGSNKYRYVRKISKEGFVRDMILLVGNYFLLVVTVTLPRKNKNE